MARIIIREFVCARSCCLRREGLYTNWQTPSPVWSVFRAAEYGVSLTTSTCVVPLTTVPYHHYTHIYVFGYRYHSQVMMRYVTHLLAPQFLQPLRLFLLNSTPFHFIYFTGVCNAGCNPGVLEQHARSVAVAPQCRPRADCDGQCIYPQCEPRCELMLRRRGIVNGKFIICIYVYTLALVYTCMQCTYSCIRMYT